MRTKTYIMALCCIICIILFIQPVPAAGNTEKITLYESDFSSDPKWTTNSPSRYYWDGDKEMYHYLIEKGTGGFAYVPVEYDDSSFTLEFDIIPTRTDKYSTVRFGLGDEKMDVTSGPCVFSEFDHNKYGRLMALKIITQDNNLIEVTSHFDSYGAKSPGSETKKFEDNETYHVILRYNKDLTNADVKVLRSDDKKLVWGYYADIGQEMRFMDRILLTSRGEYGYSENTAEGYIDNVVLYAQRDIPETTVTTTVPTTAVNTRTMTSQPTTRETTAIPTTESASSIWIPLISIGLLGMACSMLQNKKRR